MAACDHADDGPCTGGPGTFTPEGTDVSLCRRHYNLQSERTRPSAERYVPQARGPVLNEYAAHDSMRARERVISNAVASGGRL